MGSFTFQTIVLVLIGAAVFALGTINIRGHFRMKRPGVLFKGKVLNVKLLERRDKEDRLIQHYYELQVQCRTTDKTFNIEMVLDGYSARVIREWYTHIGGAPTRLQASTRYINYQNFEFVIPPSVKNKDLALERYRSCMEEIQKCASFLIEECQIPKEDAAMLLPLGMETKIVDKRNLRNFLDICKQRMCMRAYWEYRDLMRDILKEIRNLSEEWELIVDQYCKPKCEFLDYCPEKKSCGRFPVK